MLYIPEWHVKDTQMLAALAASKLMPASGLPFLHCWDCKLIRQKESLVEGVPVNCLKDWWGSIKALQGQTRWGSEDQQSNKEMNVGYIRIKSQTEVFQTKKLRSPKSLVLAFSLTCTVIRRIGLWLHFFTLVPRNNRQCWNTKKDLRVNSNKINQKQINGPIWGAGGGGQCLWVSCLISYTYEQKKEGESRDL